MSNRLLYEQGTQRIEVIVRKETADAGEEGNKEKETENVTSTDSQAQETRGMTVHSKRLLKTTTLHMLTTSKQVANTVLDYSVSGIGLRNGDQALQEQIERNVEIYKDVSGFATSVIGGGLSMSWGGIPGIAIGAGLGAISSMSSIFFKYRGREREYNYNIFKENNAIQYQRARANINLTTGRLR